MKRSLQSVFAEIILATASKKRLSLLLYDAKSELDLATKKPMKEYRLSSLRVKRHHLIEETKHGVLTYTFPNDKDNDTVIIYLHGGSYLNPPLLFHWNYLDKLHNHFKAKIIVPIYPRAPYHHAKESMEKILSIYKDLIKTTDPSKVVLMGDSAGGGFALALSMRIRNEGLPIPRAQILFSPWLDLEMKNIDMLPIQKNDPMLDIKSLSEIGQSYAGSMKLDDYQVSPINGDFHDLPPITLFVGTREIFLPDCRLLKIMLMVEGIKLNYYEYEGMNHVFPLYPIPEANEAMKQVLEVLRTKVRV